jgi:hypothetical protein
LPIGAISAGEEFNLAGSSYEPIRPEGYLDGKGVLRQSAGCQERSLGRNR